jgi:nitrite reductase/ring-hydroxylating ferredoxin subunit
MINLIHNSEIPNDSAKGLKYKNISFLAIKKDEEIFLYLNRCPHLGTPLEWSENDFLDSEKALIRCATHGALFQINNGKCLVGPCQGKHLQSIPFEIENGDIRVQEQTLISYNF